MSTTHNPTHRLLDNVFSVFPDKKGTTLKQYGKKNDRVELISEHGNVCIVEDKQGSRYPVMTSIIVKINQ